MGGMSKIGAEEEHVTRDTETTFEVKMSKGQLARGWGIMWRPPAQLVGIHFFQHNAHAFVELLLLK